MPSEIHEKIKAGLRRLTVTFMELGGMLEEVKSHELYRELGFDSFRAYIADLDIGEETAYRWVRIHRVFSPLKFNRGLILGPTKMYHLASLVNDKNVTEMLRWAAVTSTAEIIKSKTENARNRTLSLWLTDKDWERFQKGLSSAMLVGAPTKGDAAMFLLDTAMSQLQ